MEEIYRLDTAAKLFPPVTRPTNTSVYRLSVLLNEQVQPEFLQQAAEMALRRYPCFAVSLAQTAFDRFFVKNENPFCVRQEQKTPCAPIDSGEENGYLLRVLWFEKRISVEMFHALADGAGGFEFLKTLLYCYLSLMGVKIDPEDKILLPDEAPDEAEYEDSFLKYYDGKAPGVQKMPPAFKIKGEPLLPPGHEVVHGVLPVESLKRAAKPHNATITEYLSALMVYGIYRELVNEETDDEPIVLAVPVNLRSVFPSKTVRNFFCVLNISVPIEKARTFHAALETVKEQIRAKTDREYLYRALKESCSVMENPVVKAVPRFMREAGTRFVFAFFAEDVKTLTVSNVGSVDLPKDMEPYVDHAEAVIYPTERSPVNCCMCSMNGKMTISFIKSICDTGLLRFFFRFLAAETGGDVAISTNQWRLNDEQM